MKGKEIRENFLEFFKERQHKIIESSSLVPKEDQSLLFTNAGMVQFKKVFLGNEPSQYKRAVSCQKCVRAGGKHNDIENVGFTARHHTFFEMLGNFSFGDYFKKDAIIYSWQLLTERFNLPKDKLWVTIYEKDNDAASLWLDNTDIAKDRVVRMGEKDNFWQMADTGPCGPCSEIIIDQGPDVGCKKPDCALGCDCDRFLEIWNLVFMQYNRDKNGTLTPLPKPSIDTGMGLERISAVMQKKLNNYDTDLFSPIIDTITALAKVRYRENIKTDTSIRVIADHIRAITFLLTDGVTPSNEGKGYVLRRIIRRASRYAKLLNMTEPFLYKLVDTVIDTSNDTYPELAANKANTIETLKFEEERFTRTLEKGLEILEDIIAKTKQNNTELISGEDIFRLYDTYGFPTDLTRDVAKENGLNIDEQGFEQEMENQKQRGKASWIEASDEKQQTYASLYKDTLLKYGATNFLGYETFQTNSTVKLLVKEGKTTDTLEKDESGEIILDSTPFYGESGGQVGDNGIISTNNALLHVTDTKKTADNIFIHKVTVKQGRIKTQDNVNCKITETRRRSIMRNHTATHLLHAALKQVLGDHVKQAGSLVEPHRLRFDFTHFYPLSSEEKQKIENLVNEKIMDNIKINTNIMDLDTAINSGATALFDEKYGKTVRVLEIAEYSKELCGGTHCSSTGEIGMFFIAHEGSIASGIRRIEALTGTAALELYHSKTNELKTAAELIKSDNIIDKIQTMAKKIKELEKEISDLKLSNASDDLSQIIAKAVTIKGAKTLVYRKDGLDAKDLRSLCDELRQRLGSGIIFLASANQNEAHLLASVSKELTKRFNAGNILKQTAQACNGRGGGKPNMAQGGTKEIQLLDTALNKVLEIIANETTEDL
ncbi:alanyl-tRNA synthetase [Candidatus Magnetoovum chiemensis]|nr:alanyl-tRNA synthetase [Candidatus Magnetoovum chiemensis]